METKLIFIQMTQARMLEIENSGRNTLMIINHNIAALNTYNRLSANNTQTSKSLEKLSSGLRINRAGDDAAGLAISEKMRGQIRGLDQAQRNSQDTISLIQTAEGALNETHSILQRMRELAVQSSNDTNTDVDRKSIQDEVNQLADEIDRIANTTEFNTKKLLNGEVVGVKEEVKGTVTVQANSAASIKISAGSDSIASSGSATGAYTITRTQVDDGSEGDFKIIDNTGNEVASGDVTITSSTTNANEYSVSFKEGVLSKSTTDTIDFTISGAKVKVGDSFTLTFNEHQDAKTSGDKALTTQIGANSGQTMQIGIDDMRAQALGIKNATGDTLKVDDKYAANAAIATINNAIEKVSTQRSSLGAYQNRLEHTINNLGASSENLSAAESRVRDVDMAKEMMNFQKNNILSQAAQAMLAQANQQPQGVLQLLR